MKILPQEKLSAYLAAAEEHGVLPMFYLELTTGLRRGELTALLWADLDVEKRTLTVSRSAGRLKGEVCVTQEMRRDAADRMGEFIAQTV